MVNGFRYYRALESVSIASALSTALTIYPCQIRVQRWQSKIQLPTARKEWRPATAGSSPPFGYLSTLIHTALVGLEPATFRSLVRRATSSATEPTRCFLVLLVPSAKLRQFQSTVDSQDLQSISRTALPIRPSNQLALAKYGESWYSVLPAKLLTFFTTDVIGLLRFSFSTASWLSAP